MSNDHLRVAVVTARGEGAEAGGAERFYGGLVAAFRASGADACEVPVPVNESTFDTIEEAYLRCWDLDLGEFDVVVSTKAPTYMVRHRRHVCYLVHTIRVFYDMFESAFPQAGEQLQRQRRQIQRLDTLALGFGQVRRVFTIGHEVAQRLQRFNGIEASVMHPPLGFDEFHSGPQGDYIFMPGRLHPWKRVALAIEAMSRVKTPARLVLAGSGEQEAELRTMAAGMASITFAGRVSDHELVEWYANSLGVLFPPLREDYGYVTLEAFRSGKPVITCTDSGEAAVLVRDGGNGFVVEPRAPAIAAAIDALWNDRQRAKQMGEAGRAFMASFDWDRVIAALLAA